MELDHEKLLENIRKAHTDDLLDRVTAFRVGMEADAVDLIERELHRRDIGAEQIAERREECRRKCLFAADGSAETCSFCRKPAVSEGWGWFKVFWLLPLIPRRLRYCQVHEAEKR